MDGKLAKIQEYVDSVMLPLKNDAEEIDEMIAEDFNPSDWSGGNFDDAYEIGTEHGEVDGKMIILRAIESILQEGE